MSNTNRILGLLLAPLALWLSGCACSTGQACYDEAQRRIEEGPTSHRASVTAHSFGIARTYERGCELGHADSCREALAFWRTRLPRYSLAPADGSFEAIEVTVDPDTIAEHSRTNLAHLVAIEFGAAKAANTRERWVAVANEFPGTEAARLARAAEDKLIVAALKNDSPAADYVRETPAARETVLAYIEAHAASLDLGGQTVSDLLTFGLALRDRSPNSPAARRLLEHADDVSFASAKQANTEAALAQYLDAYGPPRARAVNETVALTHRRDYVATQAGDYSVEIRSNRDVDLFVSVNGSMVCRQTSSSSTERCELKGVAGGAVLGIEARGSGSATLEVQPLRTSGEALPSAGRVSGRHVDEALTLLEVAQARGIAAGADPRDSLSRLDGFTRARKLRDERSVLAIRTELADRVRSLDAKEAIEAGSPDRGFRFLETYPNAPETKAVRVGLARILQSLVATADTGPYEAFLEKHGSTPEAASVRASLAAVKRRQAAEALAQKQKEAAERIQAAMEAARNRSQCLQTCAVEAAQCNQTCVGLTVGLRSCAFDCRYAHIRCERDCNN